MPSAPPQRILADVNKPAVIPDRKTVADITRPRFEILITLGMDSLLVAGALISRFVLLKLFQFATAGFDQTLFLRVLEFVLDYGLVASATVMTFFDLAKRVRHSYRMFQQP